LNSTKLRIGFIGAGLMGHGAAKNIIEKGNYPLVTMAHRNRAPIDDLIARGAQEVANAAKLAEQSDIVFLCLPGSDIVQQTIYGDNGLIGGLRTGMIVVDMTTSFPAISMEIADDLEQKGVTFIDAPLGRSPKEAEEGKLGCFIGGPAEAIDIVEPVVSCFAENIVRTGPVGSGGTCKILNNFITLGNCAIIAEAVAAGVHLGVDQEIFYRVVSSSGANSRMFQQMMPWVIDGDSSRLQGHLRTAMKDLDYYSKLSRDGEISSFLGSTIFEIYRYANNKGHGNSFVPLLPGIMAEINGDTIHPLDSEAEDAD
jgi:3-hydroxyisobutyrate dehydrogenase-like beta-hydroxyacid dehydrogenase